MTQNIGKYQLVKKLATGGMAEVWLARQTGIEGFNRHVVLKRILPHLAEDPEFIHMFLNEAKTAARFNHPNIAQIYDLGENEGQFFIAMEFIHGEDLSKIMRRAWTSNQWVARSVAMRIISDACQALYYAHTRTDDQGRALKVVHRDISPQNILISFDGSVKLVDFGIAKAADQVSQTKSGAIKGKFAYMAPEQAAGGALDGRTDIFALGLVLYELLTSVRPLKRDSELSTLQAAMACEIEPPSAVADVPEAVDSVVMKAIARNPDDRYQNARQMQMAIEEYLVTEGSIATSVQVSQLMETLFADRLAEEARTGKPNPLTESSVSNPIAEVLPPAASRAQRITGVKAVIEATPSPAPADDEGEDTGHMEIPAGAVLPSRTYASGIKAMPSRKVDTSSTLALEDEAKNAVDPSTRHIRRPSALMKAPETNPPVSDAPRRRTSAVIAKRSNSAQGNAMPEAPPPVRRSRPNQKPERSISEKSLAAYTDVDGLKARQAAKFRLLLIGVALLGLAGLAFVWKDAIRDTLTSTVATREGGAPVRLTVISNPHAHVTVVPAKSIKGQKPIDLGDTPLTDVSGAQVGDTVVLVNVDQGIRYEEVIGPAQPNEAKLIERTFKEATLTVKVRPALRNADVWRGNQRVGSVGIPIKVFEGIQRLQIRANTLSTPVDFEVRLGPGQQMVHEVDVSNPAP